jgi:hypothetical protein
MVASKPRFPLVRCATLVCSFDDPRNSGVARRVTKEKGLDPLAGQLEGKLNLVVSSAPSHLVYFKYKLYSRNSLSLGLL